MRQFLLPIGLISLGLLLIAVETFIPSAGILGVLASAALISGVAMSYYYGGLAVGTAFMVVTGVVVTGVIAKMIRWWPHSTIGKLILVEPPKEEDLLVDRSEFNEMVGRVGQTLGLMMPGGYIEIDGKRYDAVAEVAIDEGHWVSVSGVSGGTTLKVRPISEEAALQASEDAQKGADPLARPVEDGLDDPFQDALG